MDSFHCPTALHKKGTVCLQPCLLRYLEALSPGPPPGSSADGLSCSQRPSTASPGPYLSPGDISPLVALQTCLPLMAQSPPVAQTSALSHALGPIWFMSCGHNSLHVATLSSSSSSAGPPPVHPLISFTHSFTYSFHEHLSRAYYASSLP